jgi:hypothetical protein
MFMRFMSARAGCFLAILIAIGSFSHAQGAQQTPTFQEDPNALVRKVVQNELKPSATEEFHTWRERQVKPNRTTVKQYVETADGLIARYVMINDKPLSGDDLTKENARINRLLDPKQMQAKRKQQQEDENRTRRIVGSLPDAFRYKVTGTEEKDGRTIVTLHFTPNPNFSPPNRETLVLQGMEGNMVVDSTVLHLLKIDGTMTKDVSIGWGIIGHLDKGGRFVVEQKEIEKDNWQITYIMLNFTGKALLFKTIRINEVDTSSDFRKVPKMSVAQAIDFLKKADNENGSVAKK